MTGSKLPAADAKWQFWVDRGGTFTDIVAKAPDGALHIKKLLSENPEVYDDAALAGIREFLELENTAPITSELVDCVKMGTTVSTNALLERKGDATVLAITAGLQDSIEIGNQTRPETFALEIKKPDLIYSEVIGIAERILPSGEVVCPLDSVATRQSLQKAYDSGLRSVAIVLMHAYKYPEHEQKVAEIARDIGYTQVSVSHEVSPLVKIVPRGETTLVDAYLTPILQRYVDRISDGINKEHVTGKLLFMQSSGGLVDAGKFRGRDSILSGPAGGIVGCVHTAKLAGFDKIIGFDMGGTSTDVSHYAGEFEKSYETEVAGVRMRVPMMNIHTVAAGGGSLLSYQDNRFRVGPQSAGANPGPVCYRRGGDLAVTDINICLGKIQPDYFPAIFGPNQDMALDREASLDAFKKIAQDVGDGRSAEDVAEGFLAIAVEHMAQAIKKISVSRGYNVKDYTLNCFGGAGGQHACLVAERLGMNVIFIHPLSGVLSAYGMGLADIRTERQNMVNEALTDALFESVESLIETLVKDNIDDLVEQGVSRSDIAHESAALCRYKGTDTTIKVPVMDAAFMRSEFEAVHKQRYGFSAPEKTIMLEAITVESHGGRDDHTEKKSSVAVDTAPKVESMSRIYSSGAWHDTPIYTIETLDYGHIIKGPAIITEATGTIVIEKGWTGRLNKYRHLILERKAEDSQAIKNATDYDPVTLEIFNNLFMSIAEQMGLVLQNTSQSVNVKERLDFSCAIFDHEGNLVANAPHVPVHLGSMDSTIKVLIASGQTIKPGDVFVHNNPYNGGSHLPDITVISPVFNADQSEILFYVASRAHHEDVGGITPGSMSPKGKTIYEEGVLLDCVKMVSGGVFLTDEVRDKFNEGPDPARNIEQNIADLMAQVAANTTGANELGNLVASYGLETVHAYMGYIQDNAEEAVRRVISQIDDAAFDYETDTGDRIKLRIKIDKQERSAVIDFTGTSDNVPSNFNAPAAITQAAVLYVFRCLVDDDIPLNAGCMKPITLIIPEGTILNPNHPAAVVAGNVETSQALTNALFGALGALSASQGTMNNLTFGNARYQYYETICSGSPAGPGFNGVAAVHTHMTNTRMTDPEIMELRYPVMLQEFAINPKSGGRGKWHAGDGVIRRIRFLEDMEFSILSGHRLVAPFGLKGGEAGMIGKNWIKRYDGTIEDIGGCAQREVSAGDVITIETPTGGGYGKFGDNK